MHLIPHLCIERCFPRLQPAPVLGLDDRRISTLPVYLREEAYLTLRCIMI
jgi:hypothetical protein